MPPIVRNFDPQIKFYFRVRLLATFFRDDYNLFKVKDSQTNFDVTFNRRKVVTD
ncbi:hypothetical protein LSA01_04860 [Latilactobacillus sakei]|nr:hypothetical protein LSA01_04860 [Latilactobacillus sakei]